MISTVLRKVAHIVYALYVWAVFLVSVSLAILAALVLPGLERRRRWTGAAGRLFFRLAFVPATVAGQDNIPTGTCIAVANHASYLDGMILHAFLPPRFAYVIKGEVRKVPVLYFVLRRVGSKFVNRHAHSASARDARNLVRDADSGETLGIFPEGTFTGEVGLGRFRAGAFVAATRAKVPLVPVVIRGSRDILPSGTLLPRPGRLDIRILPALTPDLHCYDSAAKLSRKTREAMLEALGEPDLCPPEHAIP